MLETGSIIRRVTHDDVEFIRILADRTKDESAKPLANSYHFAKTIHQFLEQPNYAGFFTDHAVCFGSVEVDPTNWSVKCGKEMCWLSDGQDGFKVLKAFEKWCIDSGATHITLHTDVHRHDDRRASLRDYQLDKKGYLQAQTQWIRRLV